MSTTNPSPTCTVVLFPSDVGATFAGVSRAPETFLNDQVDLPGKLEDAGYRPVIKQALYEGKPARWQASSLDLVTRVRAEQQVLAANQSLRYVLENSLVPSKEIREEFLSDMIRRARRGSIVPLPSFHLILGGDCSMAPAVMAAYSSVFPQSKVGLVYVDAHADAFVPGGPGSNGILASMAMTHLTLRPGSLESMREFSRPNGAGLVDSQNAVLFGLSTSESSNTQAQLGWLLDQNLRTFTASAVKADPVGKAKEALKWLEQKVDMILVHFDLDTVDCGQFPLGNIPTWTGLEFDDVMGAIKVFLSSEKTVALSLAEINPDRDEGLRMTAKLAEEVVIGLIAKLR